MEICAYDKDKKEILRKTYYSIGGGFIRVKGEREKFAKETEVPYEFNTAEELIQLCSKNKLMIHELTLANESVLLSTSKVKKKILSLWEVMENSIQTVCITNQSKKIRRNRRGKKAKSIV